MGSRESKYICETSIENKFEWDHPVIRRGQIFKFSIMTESMFGFLNFSKQITIRLKANGSIVNASKIAYNLQNNPKYQWNLKFVKKVGKLSSYYLVSPCDCEPGEYELAVMIDGAKVDSDKFLMLYNPWNLEDEFYLFDEAARNEYILNTKTLVYSGYSNSIGSHEWDLDQFSKPAIEILLYLLKQIDKPLRSNATLLLRKITALVNNLDDNGIIEGNWTSDYSGGKPPLFWTGSKLIFEKYLKNKMPVKYGQCFTFAAVLCSFLRLLGVGSRVVSCFECLHDSDDTLDMERYYDKNLNYLNELTVDSIWNFHCWAECYMRNSITEKYNGWHVLDATPQEVSKDGHYVCGPAPVAALKVGDLSIGYDCRYVFSEVNGDIVYKSVIDGKIETIKVKAGQIGIKISTKTIGTNGRHDITDNYKYTVGSLMDIIARRNADTSVNENVYRQDIVEIKAVNGENQILMGQDLDLEIKLLATFYSTIDVIIKCFVIQHPNFRSEEIIQKKVTCDPKGSKLIPFKVESKSILEKVKSDLCGVLTEVFIMVGNEQTYFHDFTSSIQTPNFTIFVKPEANIGVSCIICVIMENPLPIDLENAVVKLEIDFAAENPKKLIKKLSRGNPLLVKFTVIPIVTGFHDIRAVIYGPNIPTFREVSSINVV